MCGEDIIPKMRSNWAKYLPHLLNISTNGKEIALDVQSEAAHFKAFKVRDMHGL